MGIMKRLHHQWMTEYRSKELENQIEAAKQILEPSVTEESVDPTRYNARNEFSA
jgi:hypothetical protein